MKINKKLLGILIAFIFIVVIILIVIFNNKEDKPNIDTENNEVIETKQPLNDEEEPVGDENEPFDVVEFTPEQSEKVETAFNSFMDNVKYQTTIQKGDTLVYITFKDLGTVTFKMYDKTAPIDCAWFEDLVEKNAPIKYQWTFEKEDTRLKPGTARWHFETDERVYTREEQVSEVFPMKYTLYHRMASCNNFFICLGDYEVSEVDKQNVSQEYIDYLEKYDGDMTLYQNCVIIGRAVENEKLLDKLTSDFEITNITVKRP